MSFIRQVRAPEEDKREALRLLNEELEARRFAASRVEIGPRQALAEELRRLGAVRGEHAAEAYARRSELVTSIRLEADRLLIRASTAFMRAREPHGAP